MVGRFGLGVNTKVVLIKNKNELENDKEYMQERQVGLPPNVYAHACGYQSTKKLWDKLKIKFKYIEKLKKSVFMNTS